MQRTRRNRDTSRVSITSAFTSKTTKKSPNASRRSIPQARRKSAKRPTPRDAARTRTATSSISRRSAGATNGAWIFSRGSAKPGAPLLSREVISLRMARVRSVLSLSRCAISNSNPQEWTRIEGWSEGGSEPHKKLKIETYFIEADESSCYRPMFNGAPTKEHYRCYSGSMVRCRLSRRRCGDSDTRYRQSQLASLPAFRHPSLRMSRNRCRRLELDCGLRRNRTLSSPDVRHHRHLSPLLFASHVQNFPRGAICFCLRGRVVGAAGTALVGGQPPQPSPRVGHTGRPALPGAL